ncbi:hypothetical protein ElyMa_002837200 [Elysia marginata]|uniref:Uncharacterized protein n=1 Tax=Elysia marginata TaxID=1093978 RepID=A0AAV4HTC2_9GAST|nr:hypothetical protein ElyMa_002837200 [Elysia marginata]
MSENKTSHCPPKQVVTACSDTLGKPCCTNDENHRSFVELSEQWKNYYNVQSVYPSLRPTKPVIFLLLTRNYTQVNCQPDDVWAARSGGGHTNRIVRGSLTMEDSTSVCSKVTPASHRSP